MCTFGMPLPESDLTEKQHLYQLSIYRQDASPGYFSEGPISEGPTL